MCGQSTIRLNQENLANGEIRFFGLDYSLTHFSILCMDSGFNVVDYLIGSTKKKDVQFLKDKGHLITDSEDDSDRATFYRGMSTMEGIWQFMAKFKNTVNVIAIENYAFSANSSRLLQLAEFIGILKSILWSNGYFIRMIDPTSVKMFATGGGIALKKDMVEKAGKCGFEVPKELLKEVKKKKRGLVLDELDGVGTDLADSYFLAKLATTEVLLRFGIMGLQDLRDKERRIFLRVTKCNPVNMLDKEYLCM